MRLSRDDELQGESSSIKNQRMMLRQYAAEHGMTVDDVMEELGVKRSKASVSYTHLDVYKRQCLDSMPQSMG